jgi:predicted transcriptional regulator of viral defense system
MTIKSLGSAASALLTRLSEKGQIIFTLQEAQNALQTSYENTKELVAQLTRRHWLKRLGRGRYLIVPLEVTNREEYTADELVIASHLASPYYISWGTALHHYGYTEQVSRKVYIAAQTQKRPLILTGVTYQFVALKKEKFFGFQDVWIQDQKVKLASREKMLVDCLDRPDLCGGIVEAAKGLWNAREDLDFSLLIAYAIRMKEGAVCKRLGYLVEFFNLAAKVNLKRLKNGMRPGYSLLDPTLPKVTRYLSRWALQLNVHDEDLRSWQKT